MPMLKDISKEEALALMQALKNTSTAIHPETARRLYARAEVELPPYLVRDPVMSTRQTGKDDIMREILARVFT